MWSLAGQEITLHRVLPGELQKLCKRLIETYAMLPDASQQQVRDEVVEYIKHRASCFLRSCNATYGRGDKAALVARLVSRLHGDLISIPRNFDLAVYDRLKVEGDIAPPTPSRIKQQKFGILDSTADHYEADFKAGVGALGIAVVYFDLDKFKDINTRFTETVVDRTILPEIQTLIAALVDARGFAYGEGGDEFVVTLPNTSANLAVAFVEVLLEEIRSAEFVVSEERVTVTASAGIACADSPDEWESCRDAASKAKQAAKDAGRNTYVLCDEKPKKDAG